MDGILISSLIPYVSTRSDNCFTHLNGDPEDRFDRVEQGVAININDKKNDNVSPFLKPLNFLKLPSIFVIRT